MSSPAGSHLAFKILQKKTNIKFLCIICFPIPSFDLTSIFKIRFPLQIAWILPQGIRTTSLHALIFIYMTKYDICKKKVGKQSLPLPIISFCWAPEKKMPPKCFCEIFCGNWSFRDSLEGSMKQKLLLWDKMASPETHWNKRNT